MPRRRSSARGRGVAGLGAVLSIIVVQCAAPQADVLAPVPGPPTTPRPTVTASASASTSTSASTSRPTTEPRPTIAVEPEPAAAEIRPVSAADLGATWRPGCPVPPDRLRRVDLNYVGFDGRAHRGALVVHQDLVVDVIAIFDRLFSLRFPIARMQTVDRYPGASDELSMDDDNTSAFNCRPLAGTTRWSLHAHGRAIDVNPRLNPFVDRRGLVLPGKAGPFLDRRRTDPGLLHGDDPAVRAFTDRGWRWGGSWRTPIDYQHFEKR